MPASKGESVPNKDDLMFLRGPVLHTHVTGYMLTISLLYMIEFYNK